MPAKRKNNITKRIGAPHGFSPLVAELRDLILSARCAAASTINTLQVLTDFEIGRRIVEHEQKGAKRAEYGKELLKELSSQLTAEFGRGFSEDNLALMRRFYLAFTGRVPISETVSRKSPFTLSWSHYVLLLFRYWGIAWAQAKAVVWQ